VKSSTPKGRKLGDFLGISWGSFGDYSIPRRDLEIGFPS
jgi:hypothetical protein